MLRSLPTTGFGLLIESVRRRQRSMTPTDPELVHSIPTMAPAIKSGESLLVLNTRATIWSCTSCGRTRDTRAASA